MIKRSVTLGGYNTAANGWTLAQCNLGPAVPKTEYVDIPGGDGSWDISTALSDGIVRYNDRTLEITLERSDGTRQSREAAIRELINQHDGIQEDIVLPDDTGYHLVGRLHVVRNYNDLAHASVTITATCQPWKYKDTETVVSLRSSTSPQTARLVNSGRRAIVPTITTSGAVNLTYGTATMALSAGTYQWPNLLLTPGTHALIYSSASAVTVTLKYREAVLE